jgi:hypothetical protein
MPAKDIHHAAFVHALESDGWTITDDPLTLKVGETDFFVDLGAERFVTAQKGNERIAVEIKSFLHPSPVQDLKEALGQFVLYEDALRQSPEQSDRTLYVAVRESTFAAVFQADAGQMVLANRRMRLIVFDASEEVILQWIK